MLGLRVAASLCGVVSGILLFASAYGDTIPGSAFRVGHWDGNAYTAEDGSFSHCAVISSQPKSTLLLFSRAGDGSSYIGILRAGWKLPVGKTYRMSVSLDGATWGAFSAEIVEENLVRLGPLTEDRIAALRYGSSLTVAAGQDVIVLSLQDSREALDSLTRCTTKHTPRQPTAQVNAAATSESANAASADETDVKGFVRTLLNRAGIPDAAFVDGEVVGYRNAVFGWRNVSVEGALFVKKGDLSTTATELRKAEAEACNSSFLASQPVTETAGGKRVRSYEFVCGSGESMFTYALVELIDPKLESNLIFLNTSNGEKNASGLIATNAKIRKLLADLNKPDT